MRIPFVPESKVKQWLTFEELIPLLKKAFREKETSRVQMPPKHYLFFSKHKGDLRIMPCYWETAGIAAIKLVNAHFLNPQKFSLPSVTAYLFLYNPENGLPLCYLEATRLTAMRTAALAALAADLLSRPESQTVGLIGAGVQARFQLEGLLHVRTIREVRVYSKHREPLQDFLKAFRRRRFLEMIPCKTLRSACQKADILITATPSRKPLVQAAWVRPGTHINAIGADAPGKQELDPALLRTGKVVVDDWAQAIHGGEVNMPLRQKQITESDMAGEISEAIRGKVKRRNAEEITIFDSTGLALQDLAAGYLVYKKAKEAGFL